MWDLNKNKKITFAHSDTTQFSDQRKEMQFSADGSMLISADWYGVIKLWNIQEIQSQAQKTKAKGKN